SPLSPDARRQRAGNRPNARGEKARACRQYQLQRHARKNSTFPHLPHAWTSKLSRFTRSSPTSPNTNGQAREPSWNFMRRDSTIGSPQRRQFNLRSTGAREAGGASSGTKPSAGGAPSVLVPQRQQTE